jgi:CspA family cold shock protein
MAKGVVKWFDPKKGFGFVVNEKGEDVFVHYSSIEGDGFRCLRSGQGVEYYQFDSARGLTAKEVKLSSAAGTDNTHAIPQEPSKFSPS